MSEMVEIIPPFDLYWREILIQEGISFYLW